MKPLAGIPRRAAALLLTLALLGAGSVTASAGCEGNCCAPAPAVRHHAGSGAPMAHGCCAGTASAPEPCDLERGEAPRLPHGALSGAPRADGPSPIGLPVAWDRPLTAASRARESRRAPDPLATAPPGQLYLRHNSFLC